MKNKFLALMAISLTLWLWAGHSYAQDAQDDEAAKIQYLIKSVEELQGVKFIRNGSEYDAGQAADHLRFKLKQAGPRVKTAEDFIRLCASRSYVSGEAYKMRFPDGTTITAETFFRNKLKEYR
jgi:uncharacterized short protein YbdD (DUF466 family)